MEAGDKSGSGHYPGRLTDGGTTYPEHPALGVSLDSGLMEGITRSATRPDGESIREFAKRNGMARPVPDINLDGRPMEGNTYLESSALGVSLDSGLMEGLLCPEPLEQSVLGALAVIRTDETDKPERPALASQMHHKQSCFQSSARPLMDPNIINHTDVNDDIDTDLPESTAPMMNSQTNHERPCFNSSAQPMLDPEIVNQTDVNSDIDTDLPDNSAPMMNSDLIFVDWEDAIRREVLRNRSMGYRSSREMNDQLLSQEHANMSDAGIVLDQVHSEGLRQWSMFMDGKYDYETFNGLPGYYDGDLYDTEDTDEFDPDVQEGIDFITYTHSRPDRGKTRGVDTVDMVNMCGTVSGDKPGALDEPDRSSETDASHIEEVDIIGLCRCPEFGEGEDPSVPRDEFNANIGLYMPNQKGLNCVIGACMEDFDVTGDNSVTDSVAELEYNTWNDACASQFRNAYGNLPPGLIQTPLTELIRNMSCSTDDNKSVERLGHGGYVDGGIYRPRLCLEQQHSLWDSGTWNDDSVIIHRFYHKLTIYCHADDMDYPSPVVCYDCMCLMSLIWTMTSLSYDGDGTVTRTRHDGGYDCSPAVILGCLPRRLCLPWVMDVMTQFLTKINRPYSDMMLSETMYGGDRRDVCTSDTPPEACSAAGFSLSL